MKPSSAKYLLVRLTLMLSLAISSTGCINEFEPVDTNVNQAEKGYFTIKVHFPTGDFSRGDESSSPIFVDGSEMEHQVDPNGEHLLIYLNSKYEYVGYVDLTFNKNHTDDTGQSNIEATFSSKLDIALEDRAKLPEHGLIVINGYNFKSKLNSLQVQNTEGKITIREILSLVDRYENDHVPGRSKNYFTMTNSVYLVQKNGVWEHKVAFDIDKTKFFATEAEAIADPIATAYVERMSSKFTINIKNGSGENGLDFAPAEEKKVYICRYNDGINPTYVTEPWSLTVDRWGVSGMETQSYYFKNIVSNDIMSGNEIDEDGNVVYPYKYGTNINLYNNIFYTGWNSPANFRSFWAFDPHYPDGYYPKQYRPAVNNVDIDFYDRNSRALEYISYSEMTPELKDNRTANLNPPIYGDENTYPDNSREHGLWQHEYAGTYMILAAQLHIRTVDETDSNYDLYRDRTGVFYPTTTDYFTYFLQTMNAQILSQRTMTFKSYNWDDPVSNKDVNIKSVTLDNQDYVLYHDDRPVTLERLYEFDSFTMPALIENGDGKVIPWIEGMYFGRVNELGLIERLDISDNDLKSLVYDWLGAFDHFNKGRMYYATPIRHNAKLDDANNSNYEPLVGDYGVVRNHWYELNVLSVNNIGNPIDSYTEKIIPYHADLDNSLQVNIKILDWHMFQTEVDLPTSPK